MWKTENATALAIKEYRAADHVTISVDAKDNGKGGREKKRAFFSSPFP